MALPYYPPGAFYFSVQVLGAQPNAADASFQEVSGLQAELTVEEVAEGGENRFTHRLPRTAKYSNLVLKRGVVLGSSFLADWAARTIGAKLTRPIDTRNLQVSLLNDAGDPVVVWTFTNAFPVKLDASPLDSMANKILIETLELSYNYFERKQPAAAAPPR